jgi:hypothetical protein
MFDNDVYMAAMEGRLSIPIGIKTNEDGNYVARYDENGIEVEVVDPSFSWATQECTRLALEKLREGNAHIVFG